MITSYQKAKKLVDEGCFIPVTTHPNVELCLFEHAHDFKSPDRRIGGFH